MTLRIGLIVAGLMILTGIGWRIERHFSSNYISKVNHERVLAQVEQKTKDATDAKKRIADLAAEKASKVPLDTDADIDRLCQQSASCRDRKGR